MHRYDSVDELVLTSIAAVTCCAVNLLAVLSNARRLLHGLYMPLSALEQLTAACQVCEEYCA